MRVVSIEGGGGVLMQRAGLKCITHCEFDADLSPTLFQSALRPHKVVAEPATAAPKRLSFTAPTRNAMSNSPAGRESTTNRNCHLFATGLTNR